MATTKYKVTPTCASCGKYAGDGQHICINGSTIKTVSLNN